MNLRATALTAVITLLALPGVASAAAPIGEITEYSLPSSSAQPNGITSGADGQVWFTEFAAKNLTAINPLTATPATPGFTRIALSSPGSTNPSQVTRGPGTSIWFTEILGQGRVGSFNGGALLEWDVPAAVQNPFGIVLGPDGNVWFTGYGNQTLSWINPNNFAFRPSVISLPDPNPSGIAVGPDGKLWVAAYGSNGTGETISRVNTDGTVEATFTTPTTDSGPLDITAGPDGALWFVEENASRIGRITTSGQITEYPLPTAGAEPNAIVTGPDGALWFTEYLGNRIGRITTSGQITEYPLPTAGAFPQDITLGDDGNMWFTQFGNGRVGRIGTASGPSPGPDPGPSPSPSPSPSPDPSPSPSPSISVSSLKAKVGKKGLYFTSRATVSEAGSLSQTATTGSGKRTKTWCRTMTTARAAATYSLKCNLGSKGRRYLRKRSLTLTVKTTLRAATGTSVTDTRKLKIKRKR